MYSSIIMVFKFGKYAYMLGEIFCNANACDESENIFIGGVSLTSIVCEY